MTNSNDLKPHNALLTIDLLSNAMKSSSDAICIKDSHGCILIGSQGVADFFGCGVEELPGLNVYERLPPVISERTRARDKAVLESGIAESGEESWDLGYETRTVLASRSPIRDPSGKIIGILTAYKNISAIKQAYEFFEQTRKRFEKLAETCPVGIFECNPYHQLTYVNPEWQRITGLNSEDVQGRQWTDFVVSDQLHIANQLIDHTNNLPGSDRVDIQISGKHECTVELSLNRIADTDNHTLSYIGSLVDLTFRLAAQRELREKASLMRDLTRSVPAIIWQMSLDGQCVFASDHWVEFSGQPIRAFLGNNWERSVHPMDLDGVKSQIQSVLSEQQASTSFEFRLLGKNDEWRWVLSSCQQIHTLDGKFMGVAGHTLDITERRNAELELQQYSALLEQRVNERTHELSQTNISLRNEIDTRVQAEELLEEKRSQLAHFSRISIMGRLSGELAHELNQPLNAIQNYVASLAKIIDLPSTPETAKGVLTQLNTEITRAAKIIRRTREFVSTGKHQSDELKLSELIADTVAMLKGEARRRGMKIQVESPASEATILGDVVRLQQVLVNLVLNALESMLNRSDSDKTVVIELKETASSHIIDVHDSGCGVPVEDRVRLFDAFFTTKSTGLGMGLAISRGIVEAHGGTLTYSPRDGGGSSFSIVLPC